METETAIAGTAALVQVMPFLHNLLDDVTKEAGAYLRDWVEQFRKRNLIKLMAGTEKIAKDAGYDPKPLRPAILIPIIEAASRTDDETLQQMFQRLLAAFIDPNADEPHPAFIKIMADLAPLDAHVLHALSKPLPPGSKTQLTNLNWRETGQTLDDMRQNMLPSRLQEVTDDALVTSAGNLDRLGLVEVQYGPGDTKDRVEKLLIRVTIFGKKLWECAGQDVAES